MDSEDDAATTVAHSRRERTGSVLHKANSFRRLQLRDQYAVLRAASVAGMVEVGIRLLPLPFLARALGVPLSAEVSRTEAVEGSTSALAPHQRRWLWATDAVLRNWPFGDTCLRRALVLGHLLRREHPILRVGVAREARVVAHAWVEMSGMAIGAERRYLPLLPPIP